MLKLRLFPGPSFTGRAPAPATLKSALESVRLVTRTVSEPVFAIETF